MQDLNQTEVILVPVKPEQQGTYMVNIQGVRDLPGNLVQTSDRPVQPLLNPTDPYAAIDNGLVGQVAPGYRIYFGRDGTTVVILLAGGTKQRQHRDVEDAKIRWQDYKSRKKG